MPDGMCFGEKRAAGGDRGRGFAVVNRVLRDHCQVAFHVPGDAHFAGVGTELQQFVEWTP